MKEGSLGLVLGVLWILGLENRLRGQDYLLTIIPKLELANANPEEAIERIVDAAKEAGANKRGFAGVSIEVDPQAKDKVPLITLKLIDVPLGVALEYVAGYFSGRVLASSKGVVVISATDSSTHAILKLSPKVRDAFGLQAKPSPVEILRALTSASFRLDADTEIVISSDWDFALLRLGVEEAKHLECLVELVEQGLPLKLSRDAHQGQESPKE